MTGFMENTGLRMAGLDDQDIANLNAILPDLQNLIHIVQTHQAQFDRVLKVVLPLAQKVIAKERNL